MSKSLVYVDTDIGLGTPGAEIDDAAALLMLMTNDQLELLGAGSVFGNVRNSDALVNLCRLQSFFNRQDIKIGRGTDLPLVDRMEWFSEWQSHYGSTRPFLVPAQIPPSARLIIELVKTYPHQVTILCIGPMTNLALAARLEPDFISMVKEVVAMGGSFGSDLDFPEFNVRCDPEAAHIVLNAGWKLRLIGLNITSQVKYTRSEFTELKGTHPATLLLKEMAPAWIDRMEEMGWEKDGCALHDAVAVAYLLKESLFNFKEVGIGVELHDKSKRGATFFDVENHRLPKARVAINVDIKGCHDLVWSQIQKCEDN